MVSSMGAPSSRRPRAAAATPPLTPLPPPAACRRAGEDEVGCSDGRRFELELEFLHCLANPGYLNCEPHAWSRLQAGGDSEGRMPKAACS